MRLCAQHFLATARKWGLHVSHNEKMIQDVLIKLVTIKVVVVSSFARRQRRSAAQLDRCFSHVSTRTQ